MGNILNIKQVYQQNVKISIAIWKLVFFIHTFTRYNFNKIFTFLRQ